MTNNINFATWNIAGPNGNNPFEYFREIQSDEYRKLNDGVKEFIENSDKEILENLFTEKMMETLLSKLTDEKIPESYLESILYIYIQIKEKKAISEILKDKMLGKKRLMSWPDRFINNVDGKSRPSVNSMYIGEMKDPNVWFRSWIDFLFGSTRAFDRLKPLSRSKYPDLSEEEERISIPLQVLYLAIFDRIVLYLANKAADDWESVKKSLVKTFVQDKEKKTIEIIDVTYNDVDVLFLQEVSTKFIDKWSDSSRKMYLPEKLNKRNQNSVIVLKKSEFTGIEDITKMVYAQFDSWKRPNPCNDGDLLLLKATGVDGKGYILGSFHGDTQGCATIPVIEAILSVSDFFPGHKLILGVDANSHTEGSEGKTLSVGHLTEYMRIKGLGNCWGKNPDPQNYTTNNCRTYLQPQLNKAEKISKELKDYIIYKGFNSHRDTKKDNNGDKTFVKGVFPSTNFPSDHAIVSTTL